MSHTTSTTLLIAAVLVVAVVSPASVAAQSDDTDVGVLSADLSDDMSGLEVAWAVASGSVAGALDGLRDRANDLRGAGPAADDEADALADEITDHRGAYRTHLNDLADEYDATVANETEVLRVDITDDDETESVWIRIAANGSDITSVNASRTATWTATRTHELSATDAEDLNDDLDEYRTEYVDENEVPPPSYFVQQGSKYVNISEVQT